MSEPAIGQGRRVVFLADRRVLVAQAARSAEDYGLPVGIVMADAPFGYRRPDAPLQVMSKDTAVAWLEAAQQGKRRPDLPPADLLITDECHRGSGPSWEFVRAAYPNAWEVGLTATPVYPSGKGMGTRYDFLVNPASYADLIAAGVLVEPECYAPGSRVEGRVGRKPTRAAMVGDAVFWWKKYAAGLRTFLFASGVQHSMALRDEFRKAGIPAEHVDGETPDEERDAILGTPERPGRLATGKTLVVTNCNVTRYGVDVPEAECCQIVAPMTSLVDYRQSVGRVLRAAPGKQRAVVIDHAGCVLYHGFPHADLPWTLDGDEDHGERQRQRMESGEAPKPIACPECHTLYSGSKACPACGWQPKRQAKAQSTKAGTLQRVTDGGAALSPEDLGKLWKKALAVAVNRGLSCKVAASIFQKDAGRWPDAVPGLHPPPPGPGDRDTPAAELYPQFARRADRD